MCGQGHNKPVPLTNRGTRQYTSSSSVCLDVSTLLSEGQKTLKIVTSIADRVMIMSAASITTMMVILLVSTASGNHQSLRNKRQGEDHPPPNNATCPQLVLPGPPGPPGGLSYSEAKELKQDIKEELQQSLAEWIEKQAKALKLSSYCSPTLGRESHTPAMSCRDIVDCNPLAPSGLYWLQAENIIKKVFCDLETKHCGTTGWMRVAYLNMTEPGASCPTSLRQINTPAKLCGRHSAPGCSSVINPVDGIRYSKVCGQARGYQYYTTNAFGTTTNDINSYYADGVSITYGTPRRHIWTYASGLFSGGSSDSTNCPCAKKPGRQPSAFVGLHYYCESGFTGVYENRIALEDPLWDGYGCGPGNNCCAHAGMPWFCRTLPQEVSEDIEVRLCSDEGISTEEIYVDLLEVYVQ